MHAIITPWFHGWCAPKTIQSQSMRETFTMTTLACSTHSTRGLYTMFLKLFYVIQVRQVWRRCRWWGGQKLHPRPFVSNTVCSHTSSDVSVNMRHTFSQHENIEAHFCLSSFTCIYQASQLCRLFVYIIVIM